MRGFDARPEYISYTSVDVRRLSLLVGIYSLDTVDPTESSYFVLDMSSVD